jgi:site-specific DNA-methyltransferase (cytosine-N4-specific)
MPAAALPSPDPWPDHPAGLISGVRPIYRTELGAAYGGNSITLLRELPNASVNLVVTSPPYALHFKKEYR